MESPEEGAQAPVDPRRVVLLPLWRGRYLVLAATLLGVMGGVLSGIISPNSYLSVGKMIFRAGAREEQTLEMSVTGGGGGYGMGSRNVVMDELHLLSAPQVYEEAARIVTPAEVFKSYDPSARDDADTPGLQALFHRWQSWWFRTSADSGEQIDHKIDSCDRCCRLAGLALARSLMPLAEPGSNVISVSYITHDPQLAQKVVAAFLEAAIAHHRKIYQTTPALEFLSGQMETALKKLTDAENEFTNFKTGCGVYDFENQQRTLIGELQMLDGQTAQDQARLEELRDRKKALGLLVASLPKEIEQQVLTNPVANPERTMLQQSLNTLQDNLSAVERRTTGTSHERELERQQILQRIESTKQRLLEESPFADAGPSLQRIINPELVRRKQELDDLQVDLSGLEAAAAIHSAQLEDGKKRLTLVAQCGPTFLSLQAKSSIARTDFEGFRKIYDGLKLIGSMDPTEMGNLRRIQDATLPNDKEGPRRGKLVLIGLLLGGVAGCALAFAKNMLDHRLHDAVDVETLLGTGVLAVIPRLQSSSKGQPAPRAAAR